MHKVQVLVTVMNQTDFSKLEEMNIQSDVIFANQADDNYVLSKEINGYTAKLVTTDTRGTSKNRNIATGHINPLADYIMFSDDDLIFKDNYPETICDVFAKHPEAQAIKFNLNCISERKLGMKPIQKFCRATRRSLALSGVSALAIRRDIFDKSGLRFNERFGPGTENYCGEDSIFLQELIKKGIKIYLSPEVIADIDQSISSWSEGCTEKRFITAGMVLSEMFPVLSYPLAIRSAYRFSRRKWSDLSFIEILRCYYKEIKKNKRERRQVQ